MHLILIRHAERENTGVSNPPLNDSGRKQAANLHHHIQCGKLPTLQKLLSSPKLRATMTVQIAHEKSNIDLQILPELDERKTAESSEQFSKRVQSTLQKISLLNQNILLCSHLDWIEEALIHIPCDVDLLQDKYQTWGTASYMIFSITSDLWHLEKWGRIEP
jgi:broad specificity phosphatase PhoE